MLDAVFADIRYALRAWRRAPVLTGVVIASLAIGIGVNTVVFSWIQALVFRPLPGVTDASSFYLIEAIAENGTRPGTSWLEYQDLAQRLTGMRDLAAFRMVPVNVGESSRSERTYGLLVSGNYFASLGLRPAAGRFFNADEVTRAGGEPALVIAYDYWQTRFGASPAALGQTIRVNDHDLTIIGVTPAGFQGTVLGLQFDMWLPATMAPVVLNGSRELEERSSRGYYVMGRLAPGASQTQADSELTAIMSDLARTYPAASGAMRGEVLEFWRASRGPQRLLVQGLTVLQGIMFVLLLAVCGNTANLILARAAVRQRETAVRLAIGARSWRIVRLLFVENLLLGLTAAGGGTLLAVWGTQALRAMPMMTTAFPVRFQTSVNEAGLAFAMVLGVICAVLFGTAPALQLARLDPQATLRAGGAGAARGSLRQLLMAAEVALAMVVLIAAGLFLQSFRETRDDPGFERDGVVLAAYDLSGRNLDGAAAREFAARLLDRLRAVPSVKSAAIAAQVPLDIHGLPLRTFTLEGHARTDGAPDRILTNTVTPGYFETVGIPLMEGSDFAPLTDSAQPSQAIVNQEFARRFRATGEPLGRRVRINDRDYTIAGVVADSLYESYGEPPTPIVYMSYRDRPSTQGEVHLKTSVADPVLLSSEIRAVVRALDGSLPIYNVRTLHQHVETNLALRRIPARMFGVLGPLLLVLAAIGIYAVVAYTVSHRTTEIGVRLALGATGRGVTTQIVRESMTVVLVGALAGWLLVFAFYTRVLRGTLDVAAFVGVPVLLLLIATVACWWPARRAAQLDPTVALRAE